MIKTQWGERYLNQNLHGSAEDIPVADGGYLKDKTTTFVLLIAAFFTTVAIGIAFRNRSKFWPYGGGIPPRWKYLPVYTPSPEEVWASMGRS